MSGVAIGHCIAECSLNFEDRVPIRSIVSKAGVDETLGDRVGSLFGGEEARVAVHDRLCVGPLS